MNKCLYFAMFVTGSVVGSAATWQYTKKKYEQITQEEIESVKDTFSRIKKEQEKNKELEEPADGCGYIIDAKPTITEADRIDYSSIIKDNNYIKEKETVMNNKSPYVITPDEFGELDEYDTVSLVYYADKYLATYDGEIVEDIEETIGFESLNHFGEYEDDTVFVRNDVLKHDYEIMQDESNFEDIV